MRLRPLPRNWKRQWRIIEAERDIAITRGPLRAKLLIFKTCADLDRFWRLALKNGAVRGSCGAVNGLSHWVERYDKGDKAWVRRFVRTDPRYFCIIGLTKRNLTAEIVAHECVHAAFAYAKRATRTPWAGIDDFDEEKIAYPAGRLMRRVTFALHKMGYWK